MVSQVLELAKAANIPRKVVQRMLGVSRTTLQTWMQKGVPDYRVAQLQALQQTIQYCLDAGLLPQTTDELIWKGILHITECERLCSKP